MKDNLISRAAALEVIEAVKNISCSQNERVLCGKMYSQIKDLPSARAANAAPVVHGQWLGRRYDFNKYETVIVPYDATRFDNSDDLFCSVCGKPALSDGCENDVPSNYCPECGAKMDGDTHA